MAQIKYYKKGVNASSAKPRNASIVSAGEIPVYLLTLVCGDKVKSSSNNTEDLLGAKTDSRGSKLMSVFNISNIQTLMSFQTKLGNNSTIVFSGIYIL